MKFHEEVQAANAELKRIKALEEGLNVSDGGATDQELDEAKGGVPNSTFVPESFYRKEPELPQKGMKLSEEAEWTEDALRDIHEVETRPGFDVEGYLSKPDEKKLRKALRSLKKEKWSVGPGAWKWSRSVFFKHKAKDVQQTQRLFSNMIKQLADEDGYSRDAYFEVQVGHTGEVDVTQFSQKKPKNVKEELDEAMASGTTSYDVQPPEETIRKVMQMIRKAAEEARHHPKKSPEYLTPFVRLAKWLIRNHLDENPKVWTAFKKVAKHDIKRAARLLNVPPLQGAVAPFPVLVTPVGEETELEEGAAWPSRETLGTRYSTKQAQTAIYKVLQRAMHQDDPKTTGTVMAVAIGDQAEVTDVVAYHMKNGGRLEIQFINGLMGKLIAKWLDKTIVDRGERRQYDVNALMEAIRIALEKRYKRFLADLREETEIEEAVEKLEGPPPWTPTFKARMRIHPKDVEEYGGGKAIRAVKMGNNAELIARLKVAGGKYTFGVRFYATQALPKTLADAGYDVWHQGREGGMEKWVALRNKGVKVDKAARRASWNAYGEPWELERYAKKHGIELGPGSYAPESKGRLLDGLRVIEEELDEAMASGKTSYDVPKPTKRGMIPKKRKPTKASQLKSQAMALAKKTLDELIKEGFDPKYTKIVKSDTKGSPASGDSPAHFHVRIDAYYPKKAAGAFPSKESFMAAISRSGWKFEKAVKMGRIYRNVSDPRAEGWPKYHPMGEAAMSFNLWAEKRDLSIFP